MQENNGFYAPIAVAAPPMWWNGYQARPKAIHGWFPAARH